MRCSGVATHPGVAPVQTQSANSLQAAASCCCVSATLRERERQTAGLPHQNERGVTFNSVACKIIFVQCVLTLAWTTWRTV